MGTVGRLRRVVRDERASLLQGLGALGLSSVGDLAAGLTLGSITHTLDTLPGLLVLVPAAIGMRGNVFGALGSRLGTLIHTGDYRLSRRVDTPVGQNVAVALLLSISMSAALACLAKALIVVVHVEGARPTQPVAGLPGWTRCERITVDGVDVAWWPGEPVLALDVAGAARGIAQTSGSWADSHRVEALLRAADTETLALEDGW